MNKRPLIVIAIIAVLILVGAYALVRGHNQNATYGPTAPKEAENGAPPAVQNQPTIGNTGQLANILLAEQFTAVQSSLVAYLQSKYPNAQSATITGDTTVAGDGSVNFSLSVATYNKALAVRLVRDGSGNITVFIPQDSYQTTLSIYGPSSPTAD